VLVVVLVLENPDRFAIRLTEQISCRTSVSFRLRNPNATEDEHDDEDESKFRNLDERGPGKSWTFAYGVQSRRLRTVLRSPGDSSKSPCPDSLRQI
jgi:hypothetical protein